MGTLLHDLRFALRALARRPGFTAVVVLTLGIGIGASTAIFSVVNAALVRALPYDEADRLITVQAWRDPDHLGVSWLDYLDWAGQNRSFENLAYYLEAKMHLGFPGDAESAGVAMTSRNLFSTLRVEPLLGRTFLPEETLAGAPKVVVISQDLWRRRFNSDPRAVGRQLRLEGANHTIIGVMPAGFHFPSRADAWICVEGLERQYKTPRMVRGTEVMGRLRPGTSLEQARADMGTVAARLSAQYPDTNERVKTRLMPLRDHYVGDIRPLLLLLLGACGLLLLIACANVANLCLARAAAREREMSVRTVLGAGRRQLVRQLLTESVMLSLLGGAVGLALAFAGTRWLLRALIAASPTELPLWLHIDLDASVLAFNLGVSVLVGILFGLAPLLSATRVDLHRALKTGSRGTTEGGRRVRRLLVVSEMALALLLLIGAGLTTRSLVRLWSVDPGFEVGRALTFAARFPLYGYDDRPTMAILYRQVFDRLESLPGVRRIGANTELPLTPSKLWHRADLKAEGQSAEQARLNGKALVQRVTPGYFEVMSIPIVEGRAFADTDQLDSPVKVAIVNHSLAQRLWPGRSPLGRKIEVEARGAFVICGVAGDVRHQGLDQESELDLYVPFFQSPSFDALIFVVRAEGDPLLLVPGVRRELKRVSPDLLLEDVRPLQGLVARALWQPRLWGLLFGAFSAIALVLAAVGIYGVMAFTVGQRTREIGVRMALGARRSSVARLVLGEGMRLTLAGIALGVAGAAVLGRFLAGLLYQVKPTDPLTYLAISALLAAVALLATAVPTLRATRVEPGTVLREE